MEAYLPALAGGALIGLAASLLLLIHGRVAGISGIVQLAMVRPRVDSTWRFAFIVGLVASGLLMFPMMPEAFAPGVERNVATIVSGGLLVGFGTRLGSGCTSGHGVCGLSRFSKRSFVAVLVFMGVAVLTVALTHQWLGGLS